MSSLIKSRKFRVIIKAILSLLFLIAMVVCLVKFAITDDVFDKINYGVWLIVGLIVVFRE